MNVIVLIMLFFWVLGFIDSVTGYHLKIGKGFTNGLAQLGNMVMFILGFYCFSSYIVQNHTEFFTRLAAYLPFDPSVLTSMLLDTSMGGYPVAIQIAETPEIGMFTGVLVTSSIGCLVCFLLPILMGSVKNKDLGIMLTGLIPGILTVPAGLLAGGLLLGLDLKTLLLNMIPILIVCMILIAGVLKFPETLSKILTVFGRLVEILAQGSSVLVILGLFIPVLKFIPDDTTYQVLAVSLKVTITMGGGMVLSELILQHGRKPIRKCAEKLGVNSYSALGLFLSLVSPLIMFPMFKDMDTKGKIMNASFMVMGSYVIGGQMAFVAEMTSSFVVFVFILSKIIAGILGTRLSVIMLRNRLLLPQTAGLDDNGR